MSAVLCHCGHDLDSHTGTGVTGYSCTRYHGGSAHGCVGWRPVADLPDPELEADRQVIANATPGPWEAKPSGWDAADDTGEPVEAWWVHHSGWLEDDDSEYLMFTQADATFIARARSRWPLLVDQHARLQHDLHQAQAKVAALTSALERTRDNFIEAVRGHRVRDMTETLAEVESALDRPVAAEQDHHLNTHEPDGPGS